MPTSTAGNPTNPVPTRANALSCLFSYPQQTPRRVASASAMHPDAVASPPTSPDIFNDQAFTLIEMVVVTALISIMLVVAIPRLQGDILTGNGDETARWIIANVRRAREDAVNQQKIYLLNVSLDTQQMWVAPLDLADTEAATAREKGYRLPRGVNIDHVALSRTDRFSSGTISIGFYPQGYSDKAIIRMRTNDGDRLAAYIEPFLPRVNLVRGGEDW